MKCIRCKTEKRKESNVYRLPITCTTLEVKHDYTFWDIDDNFHNHNHGKSSYECSNGHQFTIDEHCAFGDCCE